MEDKTAAEKKELLYNRNLISIAISIILVVVGLWLLTIFFLKDDDNLDRGTYGDMFGGINALFSGLAFGGIIITILLQRKDIALQMRRCLRFQLTVKPIYQSL